LKYLHSCQGHLSPVENTTAIFSLYILMGWSINEERGVCELSDRPNIYIFCSCRKCLEVEGELSENFTCYEGVFYNYFKV